MPVITLFRVILYILIGLLYYIYYYILLYSNIIIINSKATYT